MREPKQLYYVTGVGGKMDRYYKTPGKKFSDLEHANSHVRHLIDLGYKVTMYIYTKTSTIEY